MSDVKTSSVIAAALFALAIPSLSAAESLREPSDFGDDPDGIETSVQVDEDTSEDVSDWGSEDDAGDEDSSDSSDNGDTDLGTDPDDGEALDDWVTTMGSGDGPIYFEFASGSGPVQRDNAPVLPAPTEGSAAPISVAANAIDVTLGININDKAAVAAQCAQLLATGETYQAFYKLYCD